MNYARGMRNNNPLNIIKSEKINWQGEVKPSTDPNFAQFETLEYGLRAALKPHPRPLSFREGRRREK